MPTQQLGSATLQWTSQKATLLLPDGHKLTLSPSEGQILGEPLATDDTRAVLATRSLALLADGVAGTLTLAPNHGDFPGAILAGALAPRSAMLLARDEAQMYGFADGRLIARIEPDGASRPDLGIVAVGVTALAAAFYDSFVVIDADGRTQKCQVQAQFPIFRSLGRFAFAAGRDLLVLGDAYTTQAKTGEGALRPELLASGTDWCAVPSRDRVHIVDGASAAIWVVAVEGMIQSLVIAGDRVQVNCAGHAPVWLGRDGSSE